MIIISSSKKEFNRFFIPQKIPLIKIKMIGQDGKVVKTGNNQKEESNVKKNSPELANIESITVPVDNNEAGKSQMLNSVDDDAKSSSPSSSSTHQIATTSLVADYSDDNDDDDDDDILDPLKYFDSPDNETFCESNEVSFD